MAYRSVAELWLLFIDSNMNVISHQLGDENLKTGELHGH